MLLFLDFWSRVLDGILHSVYVASSKIITPGECRYHGIELTLQ